jgi:lysophospholipase L1-like esterase
MNDHFDEATNIIPKPKTIVVLGWVNDLCNYALTNITPGAKVRDAQTMAEDIFKNLKSMSDKATSLWIKFIIGTLLPFDWFLEKQRYASQQTILHDATKLINDKIKSTRSDSYIDFATTFTDATNPWHLPKIYDSGDGVHLNISGYKKMQELAFSTWKNSTTLPQQSIV